MKLNNIFHALGAIGATIAIYTLSGYGMHVWQWPAITLLWIISSYFNVANSNRQSKLIEQLDKERTELIGQNIKLEGKLWEAEMKSAKLSDKLGQK